MSKELKFIIGFPTNEGFFGRECNGFYCGCYFKIHKDSFKEQMHCPYCGNYSKNDISR